MEIDTHMKAMNANIWRGNVDSSEMVIMDWQKNSAVQCSHSLLSHLYQLMCTYLDLMIESCIFMFVFYLF